MSFEDLKKYKPDTPKEFSFIGSSIMRLGVAMTTISAFNNSMMWVLISTGAMWFGHEVNEYFKLNSEDKQNKNTTTDSK